MKAKEFSQWVLANQIKVIIGTFLFFVLSTIGAKNLTISSDYRYFFGENNPQRLAFEKLQNVYSKDDSILIAVAPKDKNVFKKETLKGIQFLTKNSWQVPFSYRVDSITNFQYSYANGDELIVEDLVSEEAIESFTEQDLERVKQVALKENLIIKRLLNESSSVSAVNVTINLPGKSPLEIPQVVEHVRKLVEQYKEKFPNHTVYLSGIAMLNNAFNEAGMNDMMTLTPAMYLLILIIMAIALRSIWAVVATFVILFISALSGMGLGGWLGIPITPISSVAPTVIITLAIADSIHILKSILTELNNGMTKKEAIIHSLSINLRPVFLTSFTTAIGFLSLNFSDTPPFHDLGNITAMGVTAAFIYSILLLPILINILPLKASKKSSKNNENHFYLKLSNWVTSNKKAIVIVSVIITIFLSAQIPKIVLNDQFVNYFDKSVQFRNDSDFLMNNLTGIYQLNFDLKGDGPQGIAKPTFLKNADQFTEWLRSKEQVNHVSSLTDTFKRLNKNMHADDPLFYKLPASSELASQYLLLYEMSLPYGLDLNNQINVDKSSTRVVVTLNDITTKEIIAFTSEAEEWLRSNTPEYMHTVASSPTIMFSHITERNVIGMAWGTLIAFILITITLMIALGSIKYGLISLIPNVIPALLSYGIWSLAVGEAGFAIAVVGSVTLGIVVDDTVHFLAKFVRAKEELGLSTDEAVRYSFETVGPALVATSVVLISGFCVLILSSFKMNLILGALSALTIGVALIADVTFLPAILSFIDNKNEGVSK